MASGTAASSGPSQSDSTSTEIDSEFNDADVAFITDMKVHHDGAIAMAELADSRSENEQIKDLAARIVGAQDPEIETMQAMADVWGVDLEAEGASMPGMDMSGGMEMGDDVAVLEPLSGAAFDEQFLTLMTAHHESAVVMSERQLAEGENPQAKELAEQIIAAQTEEIAEMKTLLAEL